MPNLAQVLRKKKDQSGEIAQVISFPKPSLIQEAIVNTKKNEDGYTPLPNFICDEGYLAVLSGDAIKCLIFLNRHINGFHIDQKAMGEILVMKITGIKDRRTIRKYMAELARYQLVEIHKENGKSNIYSITYSERLPIKPVTHDVTGQSQLNTSQPVASHVPSTSNVVTFHATTPVASHVPTTSDTACHSVKEIDLKENFKEIKKTDVLVDKSKTEMFSESIEYHGGDKTEYSLRELAGVYTVQSDFMNHAKQINPKLDDEKIMSELKNFAQWSTSQNKTTAQGWMNFWIYRIKNLKTSKPRNSQGSKTEKTTQSMTPKQVAMFAPMLCEHPIFKSNFAEQGESQTAFVSRIGLKLRNPEFQRKWMNHLRDCGFAGNLEGCEG